MRIFATLAIVATGLFPAAAAAQETRLLRLATGSPAGVYYPVGVALCRLMNEDRPDHGIRCAAITSDGSVDNVSLLERGDAELALIQSDTQAEARSGENGAPFGDLMAVMALYPEPLTIVARADAGIGALADLTGKRVSAGPEGSGQRAIWEAVMRASGWSEADFSPLAALPASDQARALCDGEIDAFVTAIGHPARTVQEATLSCDAALVAAAGAAVERMLAENPAFVEATIPGGTYRGNPDPVRTFGVGATVVARADVAADMVETFAGASLSKLDRLRGLHPALRDLEPAAMAGGGLTAPLHPGAQAAFGAAGVTSN